MSCSNLRGLNSEQSFIKELKRYQSVGDMENSKIKLKFQQAKETLGLKTHFKNSSMFRDSSCLTENTFIEKVSSCEKLLNSIKVSPLIRPQDVSNPYLNNYEVENKIKKNLFASFEPENINEDPFKMINECESKESLKQNEVNIIDKENKEAICLDNKVEICRDIKKDLIKTPCKSDRMFDEIDELKDLISEHTKPK